MDGVFDLSNALCDNVSVVEAFVLPQRPKHGEAGKDGNDVIRIGWNGATVPNIPPFWNVVQKIQLRIYNHRDMSYSYDLSTDGQRCVRQTCLRDQFVDEKFFVASFQEDVLPCHRFPCTREIVHETKIMRNVYRINNRIFLHHDYDEVENMSYLYFRYQHSENVDVSKMTQDLSNAMRKLTRRSLPPSK